MRVVSQVQLGAVDRRFVGGNRSFVLPERRLLRVQVLLGDHAACVQSLHALVLRFGILQLCFVALQIGFGRSQRNLDKDADRSGSATRPCATSWPSWKLTCVICPSMRVFSDNGIKGLHRAETGQIDGEIPSAWTVATPTGTAGTAGPLALAFLLHRGCSRPELRTSAGRRSPMDDSANFQDFLLAGAPAMIVGAITCRRQGHGTVSMPVTIL